MKRTRIGLGTVAAFSALLLAASSAAAVQINPVFGPLSVDYGFGPTVDLTGNVAAISAIDAAANQVGSQFNNNVTANVLFVGFSSDISVSANLTGGPAYTYDQYVAALRADSLANPNNLTLADAVGHLGLGNGASDPDNTMVALTTPNARMLDMYGLGAPVPNDYGIPDSSPEFDGSGNYVGSGGTIDGIVYLNLDSPTSFTRPVPSPAEGDFYDAESSVEHELDEVLGIGGQGSTLFDDLYDPTFKEDIFGVDPSGDLLGTMDLYRYSDGLPSYVVNSDPSDPTQVQTAYFSVDGGVTPIDYFNQQYMSLYDPADWTPQPCPHDVQGVACPNTQPDVVPGAPSYIALQSIGYDAVPEPMTLSLLGAGLVGIFAMSRRRKTA